MKYILRLFVLTAVMSLAWLNWTHASEDIVAAGSQTLKGDLLTIEREHFVLKDPTGMEIRLHVDQTSELDSDLKAGDKIEAQVTDKDHAQSIRRDSQ